MRPSILAAVALVVLASQASALTSSTQAVGLPSAGGPAVPGLAVCERFTAAAPTNCETGGAGGATFSVGCAADRDDNGWPDAPSGCLDDVDGSDGCAWTDAGPDCDGMDAFAAGSCTVRPLTVGGAYRYRCATDRDDDGLAYNVDAFGSNDGSCAQQDTTGVQPGDCYDDEFVDGWSEIGDTSQVCFSRDRAGDDWDTMFVFVAGDSLGQSIGSFQVTLELYPVASCQRSGHDDADHHGGEPDNGMPSGACTFDDQGSGGECDQAGDDGAVDDADDAADDEVSANGDLSSRHGDQCTASGGTSYWAVHVQYSGGSGVVYAAAECDGNVVSDCTANAPGSGCTGPMNPVRTPGDLRCYFEVVSGSPTGITGYCYDPVNPTFAVPLVEQAIGA